jgi:hypothetical protein
MEDGWTTYWVIEKRPAEIIEGSYTHEFYAVDDGVARWSDDSGDAVQFVREQDVEAILSLPEWQEYKERDGSRIFAQQVWSTTIDPVEEAA